MNLPMAAGGNQLVSPVVGVMIWTLIIFGLTLIILWKAAFPRIAEALDKRQKAIEESIDHAAKVREEADELLREDRERRPAPDRGGGGPGELLRESREGLADARGRADDIAPRPRRTAEAAEQETLA